MNYDKIMNVHFPATFSYTLKNAHRLIQTLHNIENHYRDNGKMAELWKLMNDGILPKCYSSILPDVYDDFFQAHPERWSEVSDPVARRLAKRLAECWDEALVEVTCWTGNGMKLAPRVIKLREVDGNGKPLV